MKECPNCKTKVDNNNKFCTNCGSSLEVKQEVQVAAQQPATEETKGKGVATASLILGIISLILSFVTWLFFPALILFITIPVGIILGIIGLLQGSKKWGGIILNGISIIVGVASAVIVVFFASLLGFSALEEIFNNILNDPEVRTVITPTTTTKQVNPVSGYYKCSSSSDVSATNYTFTLDLWSSKKFDWKAVDNSITITGKYDSEEVIKDSETPNTKFYKITMTADKVTQNGKEVTSSAGRVNVYEAGINSSNSKRAFVMINESTYSMYYCIEK